MAKNEKDKEATATAATTEPTASSLQAPEGYELVNWTFGPRIDAGKHGIIDLRKLSSERAGQLVRAKFKYLRKKS